MEFGVGSRQPQHGGALDERGLVGESRRGLGVAGAVPVQQRPVPVHGGLGGGADGRSGLPGGDRGRHRLRRVAGLEPVVGQCGEHGRIGALGLVELLECQRPPAVPVGADQGRERVGDRSAEQLMVKADAALSECVEQPA